VSDKLLFLDFDGVLHPSLCGKEEYFLRAPLLSEVLGDCDCGIVISSSWRHHHSVSQLKRFLPPAIADRVVAVTADAVIGRHSRYCEILAYLAGNIAAADWRALDDSRFVYPESCPNLILCDAGRGFQEEQARHLRAWLENLLF